MPEPPAYLDFEINVARDSAHDNAPEGVSDSYTVWVNSLGGRAEARFGPPFSTDQRTIIRQALTNFALRASAKTRGTGMEEVQQMKIFGELLFDHLFNAEVKDYYYQCWGQALQQDKGLRLRLTLDPSLADLPWEFLYAGNEFIALNPQTPVVRFIEQPLPIPPLKGVLPLQILVVIARPGDRAELDTEAEKERIGWALQTLQAHNLVQVTYLEGPNTWPRLIDMLRPDHFNVLHFIGHGAFDDQRSEGVLLLEDEFGDTKYVGSQQLKVLMLGKRHLRLAVLNSCLGAAAKAGEPFSSVGAGLVRAGLPAVIAMQFEVSDRAAQLFAETFYESLALNLPVDGALTEARREMALAERDSLEWATPVLFMQVADGQLFDLTQPVGMDTESVAREKYSRKADEAFDRQDLEHALTYYTFLLTQDPTNTKAQNRIEMIQRLKKQKTTDSYLREKLTKRGDEAFDAQNWELAHSYYKLLLDNDPANQHAKQRLVMIEKLRTNKLTSAASVAEARTRAAENYAAGEHAQRQGRWVAAAGAFRAAELAVPGFRDARQKAAYCDERAWLTALFEQGQKQYEAGQYTAALTSIGQLRHQEPNWPGLMELQSLCECGQQYQQALSQLKAGRRDRARDLLKLVVAKQPSFRDAAKRLEELEKG